MMMKMKDSLDPNILIKKHTSSLFDRLLNIPETRKLVYRLDTIENMRIGKPRFDPGLYEWPKKLYQELRDHLQEVRNFFDINSFWYDSSLRPILDADKRRISKRSIIFLLERDIWETDEVYGDYLIEKKENTTIISYYRRDHKIQSFKLETTEDTEIKKWICQDAVRQIKDQFRFLWNSLTTELQTVRDEEYKKSPKISLSAEYLKDQLKIVKEEAEKWPEAQLLNLGRIVEIWLLIELNYDYNPGLFYLIRQAKINRLINLHHFKLLMKIRAEYNNIKHNRNYNLDEKKIQILIEDFDSLFN